MAMKLSRSTWLFDCGEDTQRQVHNQPLIRHGKMDRIFITNCSTSNILGLPGMLCTMSAAREVGLDLADIPLHLYGPPGLATFIRPLLQLSDTFISMPILVHEFVDYAVAEHEMTEPQCLDRRSCLYRVLLPPDKLNPRWCITKRDSIKAGKNIRSEEVPAFQDTFASRLGYYDGTIAPFLTRATARTNQSLKGLDERSTPRELDLPSPGNPNATLNGLQDLQWTIKCDRENMMVAARVPGDTPSWAYICKEVARVGKLHVDRCKKWEVAPGKDYSLLKLGKSVTNARGQTVHPEQVLGPDIPGRKVVVIGESSDSMPLMPLAEGADAVVHCASMEVRQKTGIKVLRSTIDQASAFCKAAGAEHLILYRFKPGQEESKAPYRRVDPSASDMHASEKAQEGFLKELNTLGRFQWVRKEAMGGYLGRARNFFSPVESPANIVQAAAEFAGNITGRKECVSIADDMDLFAVERRSAPKLP